MLAEFKEVWSGHLGRIDAIKNRIDLKPDAWPIHRAPYKAGPTPREMEKKEMDQMLRA